MDLLPYIEGRRKGKAAHDIEKQAMQDPFLSDAIDGFDAVQDDHSVRIKQLRKQLRVQTNTIRKKIVYISFAASLIFCVAIGSYLLVNTKQKELIADSETITPNKGVIIPEEKLETDSPTLLDAKDTEDEATAVSSDISDTNNKTSTITPSTAPTTPTTVELTNNKVDEPVVADSDNQLASEIKEEQPDVIVNENLPDSTLLAKKNDTDNTSDRPSFTGGAIGKSSSIGNTNKQKPVPITGMSAYKKYLKSEMKRPASDECKNAKGTVIVEFKINKEGRPHEIAIRKSLCEEANKEAIRLIENGAKWVGDSSQRILLEVKF